MTTTEAATQPPPESLLPIDRLAHAIVDRCARSYAADNELLVRIRQFDDANENDSTNPSAGGLLPIMENLWRKPMLPK